MYFTSGFTAAINAKEFERNLKWQSICVGLRKYTCGAIGERTAGKQQKKVNVLDKRKLSKKRRQFILWALVILNW